MQTKQTKQTKTAEAKTAEAKTAEAEAKTAETEAETATGPTDLGDGPTVPPFDGMSDAEPPSDADADTVRTWLLQHALQASDGVFNAVVSFGFRIRQVLAFGQFDTAEEAWMWVRDSLGTSRSRGYDYLRCYRTAVESPTVAEQVHTVDGILFLSDRRFSSEDRDLIVAAAREKQAEGTLTVPSLSTAAETVHAAFAEAQQKAREKQAETAANRERLQKAAADAKAAAKAAADASDGAEADGAAVKQNDPAKLDREKQAAYDGLTARNALLTVSDAVAAMSRPDADAESILSDLFEQGLILGGAHGPQAVIAYRLLRAEQRTEQVKQANDACGVVVA